MARDTDKTRRPSLSEDELKNLRPSEFLRMKLTDEEKERWRAIRRDRVAGNAERERRLLEEEKPILADLRAVGWDVSSVWELVSTSRPYLEALPVLVKHLQLDYSDKIREALARALAVPDAAFAWPILLNEYKKVQSGFGMIAKGDTEKLRLGRKNGIGCALGETVTPDTLEALVELIKDRSHGESRLLLLDSMHRRRMPGAWQLIRRTTRLSRSKNSDQRLDEAAQSPT